MTENEAINELYDIQNQFERSVLGAECNDEYAKEALRDNKRAVKSIKMAVSALKEIQKYRAIGNAEECWEAVEKQRQKVPDYEGDGYYTGEIVYDTWICPGCGKDYEMEYDNYDYCPNCGQAIDWGMENEQSTANLI